MIPETTTRLPALLDRLVDESPDHREESLRRRTVSPEDYRASVLRDLRWLLNSPCHLPGEDICDFPHVATSVLNYGTRNMAGATTDNLDGGEMEKHIREAIIAFEPRIMPDTIQVRMVDTRSDEPGRIAFEIKGHLWALPHPERILFRTDIDLESGACEITSST
jgi:type VI secretion system protein ImpF